MAERLELQPALTSCGSGRVRDGIEQFVVSRQRALQKHMLLALEHGIAIHRAIREWVRSAMAALGETAVGAPRGLDCGGR